MPLMASDDGNSGRREDLSSAERDELTRLRRDNRRLEMKVEILKRALACFCPGERATTWGSGCPRACVDRFDVAAAHRALGCRGRANTDGETDHRGGASWSHGPVRAAASPVGWSGSSRPHDTMQAVGANQPLHGARRATGEFDTAGASNGGTEAINGLIELIRLIARGFRNLKDYRLRLLLIGGGSTPPQV